MPTGGGGNFYLTLGARARKRFARALVVSTLEGRSSFTEAFRLQGMKKMVNFQELGHSLGPQMSDRQIVLTWSRLAIRQTPSGESGAAKETSC